MEIGQHDTFERIYKEKFRMRAALFGEFVEYERDRAARDIGLHFTSPKTGGGEIVSPVLVWFQLKGVHNSTLSAEEFERSEHLDIRIKTRHLRLWYVMPEPTYLVVYVEAVDEFFVTNIQKYVSNNFGENILQETRNTVSVQLDKKSPLDKQAFSLILRSNNLRVWQKRIHDDEHFAAVFFRDAHLIKRIATAEKRGVEIILLLRKYGSKMRSEVYFLERQVDDGDEETKIREHWHYSMPDVEFVFPYLSLAPDNDMDEVWEAMLEIGLGMEEGAAFSKTAQ